MIDLDYSVADRLLMVLPRSEAKAATYPALAHELYGTPIQPPPDAETARQRRTAIRRCQEAVEQLRRRGEPVCGAERGLWLGMTSAEAFAEYRRLRRRAIQQMTTAAPLKRRAFAMRAVEERYQQTTLGFGEAA